MPFKKLDKVLDGYASEKIARGGKYRWWWNADYVIAAAIASACRHVRKDGRRLLSEDERDELKKLERFMSSLTKDDGFDNVNGQQELWLYEEAYWLFGCWFRRLWD